MQWSFRRGHQTLVIKIWNGARIFYSLAINLTSKLLNFTFNVIVKNNYTFKAQIAHKWIDQNYSKHLFSFKHIRWYWYVCDWPTSTDKIGPISDPINNVIVCFLRIHTKHLLVLVSEILGFVALLCLNYCKLNISGVWTIMDTSLWAHFTTFRQFIEKKQVLDWSIFFFYQWDKSSLLCSCSAWRL